MLLLQMTNCKFKPVLLLVKIIDCRQKIMSLCVTLLHIIGKYLII